MLGVAKLLLKNSADTAVKPIVKKMERAVVSLPKALLANKAAIKAIKLAKVPR